ncbi:MAG TPA: DNA-processing protein DprA, partial [Thermomicrobiales bacterium]
MSDPRLPWLGFHLTKGIGPSRIERLLDHFGDLSRAWNATPGELERAGLGEVLRANLTVAKRTWDLERELARVEAAGVTLLTRDDPAYPARLRQIAGAPPILYIKGALTPADDLALGIVGTRRATAYGREVTTRLAGELAA